MERKREQGEEREGIGEDSLPGLRKTVMFPWKELVQFNARLQANIAHL